MTDSPKTSINEQKENDLSKHGDEVIINNDKKLSKEKNDSAVLKRRVLHAEQRIEYSGPIPHPDLLGKFNEILPDAAERIFTMAEKEQDHRHSIENKVIEGDVKRSYRGLIFGFIITLLFCIGGIYLVATGRDLSGFAAMCTPLAGLVAVFIYSQESRKKERLARNKALSEQESESNSNEKTAKTKK